MTILLIDDSRFHRMAHQKALSRVGYNVIGIDDGLRGVEIAREKHPDLILLDMMLPRLSGPEVLRALKSDPVTTSIPVVVLTSLSERNKEKLMNDGAVDFLEKSDHLLAHDSAAVVKAVEKVLNQKRN